MSNEITYDDVEFRFYETAAASSGTKLAVQKNVTILSLAASFWDVNRKLKQFVSIATDYDFRNAPGMVCQSFEKLLSQAITSLDSLLDSAKKKGLDNRTLIAGALYSIAAHNEKLKDLWVNASSSADAELDTALAASKNEESVSWESLWK